MKFKTDIELPSPLTEILHSEEIILMGSCFTEYIGQRMQDEKFNCVSNPFGILFNPLSILEGIRRLQNNSPFQTEELFFHNGLWHSFTHHGCFSSASSEEALRLINERYLSAATHFTTSHLLLLTWGSAFVYFHKEKGSVVANCHKLPATQFERRRLSVEEITKPYLEFLHHWMNGQPTRRVMLTVSPVRHIRDGLRENQLSKATLLLAADSLQKEFPGQISYFPAYEIQMDELRDYRFYDADMLHPSSVAKEYIYERFAECCFPPATQQAARECSELWRMLKHRPLHPDSDAWQDFISRIETKIKQLEQKYPYLTFNKEIKLCHTL